MSGSTWADAFAELGGRLIDAGVSARDVVLPSAVGILPRMGALIVALDDGGAQLQTFDAGRTRMLGHYSDPAALVAEVAKRVLGEQPPRLDWPESRVPEANAVMLGVAEQVTRTLTPQPDKRVAFDLVQGGIVDRFGTNNGFLLYPGGTPYEQRSLPPSEIDPAFPDLGLVRYGIAGQVPVTASLIQPGFGQPGGGVVLELADPSATIRELLVSGALRQLRLI